VLTAALLRDRKPDSLRRFGHHVLKCREFLLEGAGAPNSRGRRTELFGASHRAPRHVGQGRPPLWDRATDALRSIARSSHRDGLPPYWDRDVETLRRFGIQVFSGRDTRSLGVRQSELFGAPRAEPHRVPRPKLFGASEAGSQRERVSRALRSPGLLFSFEVEPSHWTLILTTPRGVLEPATSGSGTMRMYTSPLRWRRGRHGPAPAGVEVGQDGNGRKATATVMWYGCWRGKVFEGCELRRGDCPVACPPSGGVVAARMKRGEPLVGCGVQQTRNSRVEKTVVVVRNHEGGT
jgi:hypothetical protein